MGRPHSAGYKDDKRRTIRYDVGVVYGEIMCLKGLKPIISIDNIAHNMMSLYLMATDDECAEIEHHIGDFKPTDKQIDSLYHTVYETIFGSNCTPFKKPIVYR